MPSGPDADTTAALSEQCTLAMDMDGEASVDSLPEDAAVSAGALVASAEADSEAVVPQEVFD